MRTLLLALVLCASITKGKLKKFIQVLKKFLKNHTNVQNFIYNFLTVNVINFFMKKRQIFVYN